MENIEENNKLIAEFMSGSKVETHHNQFHTSWNELMPVVGKLSNIIEEPEELDELRMALLCNDIDTAYNNVVDLINNIKN